RRQRFSPNINDYTYDYNYNNYGNYGDYDYAGGSGSLIGLRGAGDYNGGIWGIGFGDGGDLGSPGMLGPIDDIRGSSLIGGLGMLGPVDGQGLVDGELTPSPSRLNPALSAPGMLDPVSGFDSAADDLASLTRGLDILTASGGQDLFSPNPADLGALSAGMPVMPGESDVGGMIVSLQDALRNIAGRVRGIA
ncbi:hypothetical protein BG015_005489, partial [Linnemannia schmuckeri]